MALLQPQVDTYTVAGDGTLSFDVTHPGGGSVLLLLAVGWDAGFGDNVTGETYNSLSGTLVTSGNNGSIHYRLTRFENPATGTQTIAFSGPSQAVTPIVVHACWFTGVDQITPIVGPDTVDQSTGAFTTPSHIMTVGADERLFMLTNVSGGPIFSAPGSNVGVVAVTNNFVPTTLAISFGTHWTTLSGHDTINLQASLAGNWASASVVLNAGAGGVAGAGSGALNYMRRRRMAT